MLKGAPPSGRRSEAAEKNGDGEGEKSGDGSEGASETAAVSGSPAPPTAPREEVKADA